MASPSFSSSSSRGSSVGSEAMKGGVPPPLSVSPKEGGSGAGSVMCLCSPTTHEGSFRCRYHRSSPSSYLAKRSTSVPANRSVLSPKSVESM